MNGLNQYKRAQLDTVSAEDSIALIYDGARRFVDKALLALEAGNYFEVSQNVGKAQRIFEELTVALNADAGEISANLAQLYEYWIWRLSQGVIHKDPAMFREVSTVLGEFRDAWADAARQVRTQKAVAAGV